VDITKIKLLLRRWTSLLDDAELIWMEKAEDCGGLSGRIKRTHGEHIVFDVHTNDEQIRIQNDLSSELPELSHIIKSDPSLMNGFQWQRADYIYLYFEHFRLVVEKISQILNIEQEGSVND